MVKVKKKRNRRLKKQVRKTLGALLMASAITVAAIPVPETKADGADFDYNDREPHETGQKIFLTGEDESGQWKSGVPILPKDEQIYADKITVDGYNVVYYYAAPGNNTAVILGVEVTTLPSDEQGRPYLAIPDRFISCQAYDRSGNFCAVNGKNEFLYYQEDEDQFTVSDMGVKVKRSDPNLRLKSGTTNQYEYREDARNEDGTIRPIYHDAVLTDPAPYYPCFRQQYNEWKDKTLYWYDVKYDSGYRENTSREGTASSPAAVSLQLDNEPTQSPGEVPTEEPTQSPDMMPTEEPTQSPDMMPTEEPTQSPDMMPTEEPTQVPSAEPTEEPAQSPTEEPVQTPDTEPTEEPMQIPTEEPASPGYVNLTAEEFTYKMDNSVMAEQKVMLDQKTTGLKDVLNRKYQEETNLLLRHFHPIADAEASQRYFTVDVKYIGQQYLKDKEGAPGEKEIAGLVKNDKSKGIFVNAGIAELRTSENLIGIGDYAFYNTTSLVSIKAQYGVNNGIVTIGNGAFAYCTNLEECDLAQALKLEVIGMDTFLGCVKLKKIALPTAVKAIGDYSFMGCTGLEEIILNDNLVSIGHDAFVDCSSLASITFPVRYTEKVPITYFKGCRNLQFMKIQNEICDVVDGGTNELNHNDRPCDIDDFITNLTESVQGGFYFEGPDPSNYLTDPEIYKTAQAHTMTYVYDDKNDSNIKYYEKIEECTETAKHTVTYRIKVNKTTGAESLDKPVLHKNCKTIVIPENVGGHFITTIDDGCFAGYCYLESVTIPSSVTNIGANAFQGCHNLKVVIFEHSESEPLQIAENAFNTQDINPGDHVGSTTDGVMACPDLTTGAIGSDNKLARNPQLSFVGPIFPSFGAFDYAMQGNHNFNNGNQVTTYITYYSGWPTNLTVRYNPERTEGQRNELINYPSYGYISSTVPGPNNDPDTASDKGYNKNDYPYLTANMIKDAKEAVDQYRANMALSPYFQSIIDAGINVKVPAGVTSIKTGLFSDLDENGKPLDSASDPDATSNPDVDIESIILNTVYEVEPYAFAGCKSLESFTYDGSSINEAGTIGNYAFKNCKELSYAEIGPGISSMGIRPFAGCSELSDVNFVNNTNFRCDDQIIFGCSNEAKTSIVECLESRSGGIDANELEGVVSIQEEAFKGCNDVRSIDLSKTTVTSIPRQAFAQMDNLGLVTLPATTTNVGEGAFWNTPQLYEVHIPNDRTVVSTAPEYAFEMVEEDDDGEIKFVDGKPIVVNTRKPGSIKLVCSEGSVAGNQAGDYNYIKVTESALVRYYVIPQGVDNTRPILVDQKSISTETLNGPNWEQDRGAIEPQIWNVNIEEYKQYQYPGYTFQKWGDYEKREDGSYESYAVYVREEQLCTVNFVDVKNTNQSMVTIKVLSGTRGRDIEGIPEVADPEHFIGWEPDASADVESINDAIYQDVTFYARYSDINVYPTPSIDPNASPSPGVNPSGNPNDGNNGGNNNNNNNNGGSKSSASPSASASASPSASPGADEVKKYTVSVSGGSGSGSYAAGEIVPINAYFMGEGQVFDKWTSSTAGVGFADPNAASTTFTMPAANVAVTATYKTGGAGTAAANGSSGGGSGNSGGVSTVSNTNNGTVVDVTKPGFSNTNLAGATVSGATDNFVVKVTEDQTATDAATAALQARFGDLSRIKYLPMDISLYDSTGRTKIADTTGISVNLTLPLPDDLVQYAGNNKVAAVANGALEDLNARFTTVGGVPCVNFTATHFSPYVIYVDTANLTEATIDATPKTGDPIHPKWFLSLGMACLALVLFFKRDKPTVVRKKVA